jgi:hypothetical protein
MSNDVALFPGNLPSYLKGGAQLDATTKALVGSGGGKRISIKGSVFRLVVDGQEIARKEERFMDVVVVAAASAVGRTYYEGSYQEGVTVQPDCWSSDGITPDASSESVQSKTCATCPQNVAGSGQKNSRACRYSQRIAVVMDNDMTGDVFQITLPAQSIFGKPENGKMPLQAYAKHLAGHGVPITAVVTEMRFDMDSATPKLTFKPKRPLSKEEFDSCKEQGTSADALSAITMTVAQMDKAPTKSERAAETASKSQSKRPAAQEKETPEDPPAGEAAEPTVRASKSTKEKVEAVSEKMGVAATLAAWDDED